MTQGVDNSTTKFTTYTVDSWNPPLAYGSSTIDAASELADDKTAGHKKTRSLTASEMNAFWSASTLPAKTALPMAAPDQTQRIAFADNFKTARKSRCTVTTRTPPPVVGFIVADEDNADAVDAATINLDGNMCGSSINGKTVVWSLATQSNMHATTMDDVSASRMHNALFLPQGGRQRYELPTGRFTTALDFAPDSPILLTGSSKGEVGLWSIELSRKLVSYTGLTSRTPVWDLSWSPAALYFASGSGDSAARIWRSDIPFPIRVLPSTEGGASLVRWHPSCQLVAVASNESIRVHEISGPAMLFQFDFKRATAIEFSPTGYLLAAANAEGLTVWETNTGTVIFQFDTFSTIVGLSWSWPSASGLGDGGLKSVLGTVGVGHPVLVSIEEPGRMRVWDRLFINKPNPCELSFSHPIRPLHMHFTPKNLLVVAGAKEKNDYTSVEKLIGFDCMGVR